jgi:hypothetical protein
MNPGMALSYTCTTSCLSAGTVGVPTSSQMLKISCPISFLWLWEVKPCCIGAIGGNDLCQSSMKRARMGEFLNFVKSLVSGILFPYFITASTVVAPGSR